MLLNFQILTNNFNQSILEKNFIKYFSYNKIDLFLQELMFLGFEYAFTYSFSLNIENFKNYFFLTSLLRKYDNLKYTYLWGYNLMSVKLMDFNNKSFLSFKKFFELIKTYSKINPISNSLHLMINTGAKANWTQLLQLIGFRGYLSNAKGYLYEIPIMQNFQKGLNIYEYFISCYGARKGILDTAIKTSDSGYLTRRLVESSRDIIIKEYNCGTNTSLTSHSLIDITGQIKFPIKFLEGKKFNFCYNFKKTLLYKSKKYLYFSSNTKKVYYKLKNWNINLSGVFNWISGKMICKQCLGLNYKFNKLGESLGILSAHSISEPGTQLTLRTFHTGGVVTDLIKHLKIKTLISWIKFNYKLFLNFKFLSLKNKFKIWNNYKTLNLNQGYLIWKDKIIITLIWTKNNFIIQNLFNNFKLNNYSYKIQYKNFYNIKYFISLKFLSIFSRTYKPFLINFNQLITLYPLDFILTRFNNNYIYNPYFTNNYSYQIFNQKNIFLLEKNKTNQWLVKNLNTNIIYMKKIEFILLGFSKKLLYKWNNNYINLLKLKKGYTYKTFLYNYLNYYIIKVNFNIKSLYYYKKHLFNYIINKIKIKINLN
uniref:DNA-directed RNA polymerase n=1 Tax=Nephromyces sp. ex Molgula occidentalis TaxID=2544991 RepID=A0A5C1H7T0_9APIC|nr:plastid-encoded DNA-directed RNA polymerase beta''A [Nephromyces sp. ex Molgula occidentalis]